MQTIASTLVLAASRCFEPEGRPLLVVTVHVALVARGAQLVAVNSARVLRRWQGDTGAFKPRGELLVVREELRWPRSLMVGPVTKSRPDGEAFFSALVTTDGNRQSLSGTYDERWLRTRFPAPPDDEHPEIHMTAPHDQRLAEGYWKGDEPFSLKGFSAEHPLWEGKLPGIVGRVFVRLKGNPALHDLRPHLDTLTFFPDERSVLLTYRAVMRIQEDDGFDVDLVCAALEHAGRPKPLAHYEQAIANRLGDKGHLYALRDSDLLPEDLPREPLVDPSDGPSIRRQAMSRRAKEELASLRQQVADALPSADSDLDPKIVAFGAAQLAALDAKIAEVQATEEEKLDLDPDKLPELVASIDEKVSALHAEMEKQKALAEQQLEESKARARVELAKHGHDLDAMLARAANQQGGPPKLRIEEQVQQLRDQLELGRNAGVSFPDVEAKLADANLVDKMRKAEGEMLGMYRKWAHHLPTANIEEERSQALRREVEAALAEGGSLVARDLTGADLSGLDLSGRDFTDALLETANLEGTHLERATLRGAVLTRARLNGAKLGKAILERANLGGADLRDADLSRADLREAVLGKAIVRGADFSDARLDGADLWEAALGGAKLDRATFGGARFVEADLSGMQAEGADLSKSTFIGTNLSGANLRGAKLTEAVFVSCRAEKADLRNVDAERIVITYECHFEEVDLRGAQLPQAGLMRACFDRADFSGALLDGANFDESSARDAKFYRAVAKETRWRRADLTRADLTACNLMQATLDHTLVASAKFLGANLYGADLLRLVGDDATSFAEALLDRAKLVKPEGGLMELSR